MKLYRLYVSGLVWAFLLAQGLGAQNQVGLVTMERHASGQNVAPIYEGWYPKDGGTKALVFSYLNRNYEEELDIPIGPNNYIEPGPQDQGQPTHFLARRHKNIFEIVIPGNTPADKAYTWYLTIRGKTDKIAATLNPIWQIDHDEPSEKNNKPPVVNVPTTPLTVTMPAAATLTVNVTDDGNPKPPAKPPEPPPPGIFADMNTGLAVEWSKFRGPGTVTFSEDRQKVAKPDVTTQATFSQPGEYVILVVADDGSRVQGFSCCWTNGYIKVTVRGTGRSGGQ